MRNANAKGRGSVRGPGLFLLTRIPRCSQQSQPIALPPNLSLKQVPRKHLLIESLPLSVRSQPVARAFLSSRQLLKADAGYLLTLTCEGLQTRLVEESPVQP